VVTVARRTIGVGFLGCGVIAQVHAAGLAQLERDGDVAFRAVAGADPSEQMRAQLAHNWPVPRLSDDPASVIEAEDVDAVIVATPTFAHVDAVHALLGAGKDFYCEKPLAPSYVQVREVCRAVSEAGDRVVAQVGFHSRFHPLLHRVRDLVESGELGKPMGFTLRDDQYWPVSSYASWMSDWRADADRAGGGALLEHSIHSVDILNWLFGRPARVSAATRNVFGYGVEDSAAVILEYENGVVGTLLTIFNGVTDREERRFEIFFERGALELTTDFLVGAPEDSLLVQRPGTGPERLDTAAVLEAGKAAMGVGGRTFPFFQYLSDRAFLLAVADRRPASPDFADALAAHAVIEGAYRSAASGEPVRFRL
jgi:predicted dehydrogenase